MGEVAEIHLHGSGVSRAVLIDYLSLTTRFESDSEIPNLLAGVKSAVLDVVGYAETSPMPRTGNYGQGEKFDRINGQIKWTSYTQAALNDWDELGRCVGTMNVTFTGSSGIGMVPIDRAMSLIQALADLGFGLCRRIDLTVDVYDDWDMDIFYIRDALEQGRWRIPRRDPRTFTWQGSLAPEPGKPTPATLYLGRKDSLSRVVVYDKAAQLGQERAWIRFERVTRGEDAQRVFEALLGAIDAAWETGTAVELLDNFVTAAVKEAADIRDVTGFPDYPDLPKNWMRSPTAITPPMLSNAYQQVAPLNLGELRLAGGFAAQARHAIRSTGKTVWKMAILEVAQGREPGAVALHMGYPHHKRVTDEDFMEMAQVSGIPIEELEAAEEEAILQFWKSEGLELTDVTSDRSLLRAEALKRLTTKA